MQDCFTREDCVNGCCPMLVEEQRYGVCISTCDDYCGTGYTGCSNCYFEDTEICNECQWKEEYRDKKKNEAAHCDTLIDHNDNFGNS